MYICIYINIMYYSIGFYVKFNYTVEFYRFRLRKMVLYEIGMCSGTTEHFSG